VKTLSEISAIIPTLNAAATLATTLTTAGPLGELIVVDGGSRDETIAIARNSGARVIASARGRGAQLMTGIDNATGEWLFLLHADTRLTPDWRDEAAAHMRDNPDKAAYFRFLLDSSDKRARRLERLVAYRCRIFALPYGDQGLLIHRNLLRAAGGMRPLPLMEDVDLIRRLGRDRLVSLTAGAVTSATKWERDGWYRRSCRNLFCLSLWQLGVPPARIARIYG
jgi:rSAM/selenodomain-associated transferase 2